MGTSKSNTSLAISYGTWLVVSYVIIYMASCVTLLISQLFDANSLWNQLKVEKKNKLTWLLTNINSKCHSIHLRVII